MPFFTQTLNLILFLLIVFIFDLFLFFSLKYINFLNFNFFFYSLKKVFLILIIIEFLNFFILLNKIDLKTSIILKTILSILILLNFFKKVIVLKLLKKSILFKKKYKQYILLKKPNYELFLLFLQFVIQKCSFIYKEYPLQLFLILIIYSYTIKNILLLSIFWCHLTYDAIVELPFFSDFKRTREQDIRNFNFHWNFDKDLLFINKLLIILYTIGFVITYFSYFFYYTSLGELGVEYHLSLINYSISIKDIQYFFAMNIIGPSILIFCIVVKLLCNLHVIFFRNPSTIYKGFAAISTSKNILGLSTFVLTFTGTALGYNSGYHAGIGPQNTIKNLSDYVGDGVVRHTQLEDKAFLLTKKYGFNINPKDIILNDGTKLLNLPKLHAEMSLPKNANIVSNMSAIELNSIGFSDLISDTKLLRHNLNVCCGFNNGTSVKEDYILRVKENDRNLILSLGIDSPSKEELHVHYKTVVAKLCATPKGTIYFDKFLKGESDALLSTFLFQKEFGFLSNNKSWASSVYVDSAKLETKSDSEKVFEKIPTSMLERSKKLHVSDLDEENLGETLKKQINRPMPLLIKNEPENP